MLVNGFQCCLTKMDLANEKWIWSMKNEFSQWLVNRFSDPELTLSILNYLPLGWGHLWPQNLYLCKL